MSDILYEYPLMENILHASMLSFANRNKRKKNYGCWQNGKNNDFLNGRQEKKIKSQSTAVGKHHENG